MTRIFGFDEFRKDLEKLKQRYPQALEKYLIEMALRLEAKAKRRTPVDTGQLRRNWAISEVTKNGDELRITVFNPTEYALHVEYGHRTRNLSGLVPGYYMFTASLKELEREMPSHLQRMLRELI